MQQGDQLDPPVRDKQKKKERLVERALAEMEAFAGRLGVGVPA